MKKLTIICILTLFLTSCTSQTSDESLSDISDKSVVSEVSAADKINSEDAGGNSSPISDITAASNPDEPDYEYISFEQESGHTFSAVNGDIEFTLCCSSKNFADDGDTYNNYEYTVSIHNRSEKIYELDCKNIYVSASGYSTETPENGSVYTLNGDDRIDYSGRLYLNNDAPIDDHILVNFADMEIRNKTDDIDYKCISGCFICEIVSPE